MISIEAGITKHHLIFMDTCSSIHTILYTRSVG